MIPLNYTQEKITSGGVEVLVNRPVKCQAGKLLKAFKIDISDPSIRAPNSDDPQAAPLRLFKGDCFALDLSKRKQPMPFWHRNLDHDELIFCFKGEVIWETDQQAFELKPGEILLIPKGIAHRVSPREGSEYIALEIKSKEIFGCIRGGSSKES